MSERTLTDADVAAIAAAVARTNSCAIGITPEEAGELRDFVLWMRKLKNAVGNVVIYGLIAFLAALFYMGAGRWKP